MEQTRVDAVELRKKLNALTLRRAGYEPRAYLSMSEIAGCPVELYRNLTRGRMPPPPEKQMLFYLDQLLKQDLKARLAALGLFVEGSERELVAEFDTRFRGHTDGELRREGRDLGTLFNLLLKIRPVYERDLIKLRALGRPLREHELQVQCYLRHGGYDRCELVYVARDSGALWAFDVPARVELADEADRTARRVLNAVDAHVAPHCTCGQHDAAMPGPISSHTAPHMSVRPVRPPRAASNSTHDPQRLKPLARHWRRGGRRH